MPRIVLIGILSTAAALWLIGAAALALSASSPYPKPAQQWRPAHTAEA